MEYDDKETEFWKKVETNQRIFKIKFKTVYGNRLIYPVNSIALSIARLMGKKTFKRNELDIIKGIGFNIQVEPDVLWLILLQSLNNFLRSNKMKVAIELNIKNSKDVNNKDYHYYITTTHRKVLDKRNYYSEWKHGRKRWDIRFVKTLPTPEAIE